MATTEECRTALEALVGRLADLDADARSAHLADRTMSCRVRDLGITFTTRLGPDGAGSITEAVADSPEAQIKFSANSDVVVAVANDPASFARAWLTGRLRVEANIFDLLRLRRLM